MTTTLRPLTAALIAALALPAAALSQKETDDIVARVD